MKKLLLIALLASMSLSAFADGRSDFFYTSSAPTASTEALVKCNNGSAEGCIGMTVAVPFSSTTMMLLSAALKEDIQQAEPDAYAFLAGEEMTLALLEIVARAREVAPELHELNDKEVVSGLINLI